MGAIIKTINGISPVIPSTCFIAENATIVGDVVLGEGCNVWFNAVIRGDVNSIRVGKNSNIQDAAILHCTYKKASLEIGSYVSIGHAAIVHGCVLKDHVLVGMGAIVMDHAIVNEYCIIAAGSVVLENTVCESGFLYAGTPAKKIKELSVEQRELIDRLPNNYLMYTEWFKA